MDATDTKQVGETELASLFLIAAFCRRPNDRLLKMGYFPFPGYSFYINGIYQCGLLTMARFIYIVGTITNKSGLWSISFNSTSRV